MPKLVLISDTHQFHSRVTVPDGDILVFAGDMCSTGSFIEAQSALNWLNKQPYQHVVAIAGNHDFAFERARTRTQLEFGRINYLENSGVEIEGLKFYGSPVTPRFMDWAFNVDRGAAIRKYWDLIPEDTDVLVTHGPPAVFLDQSAPHLNTEHFGCLDLRDAIARIQPQVHVFGHIHGGYGQDSYGKTRLFNASICDESYRPVNKPWVVEL